MTTLSNDQLTVELDDLSLALKVTDKRSGAVWVTPGAGFDLQTYDNGNQHYRWYSSRGVDLSKTQYGANPASDCRIELRKESELRAAARPQAGAAPPRAARLRAPVARRTGGWHRTGQCQSS